MRYKLARIWQILDITPTHPELDAGDGTGWQLALEFVTPGWWDWTTQSGKIKFGIGLCGIAILFCVHNLQFCVVVFRFSTKVVKQEQLCLTRSCCSGSNLPPSCWHFKQSPNAQKQKNTSVCWVWFVSRFDGDDWSQLGASLSSCNSCSLTSSSQTRWPLSSVQQCFACLSNRRSRPWTFELIWTSTDLTDLTHLSYWYLLIRSKYRPPLWS